jgi:hypothetical protein
MCPNHFQCFYFILSGLWNYYPAIDKETVLRIFLLISIVTLLSFSLKGQNALSLKLDGKETGKSLSAVIENLEVTNNVRFYFVSQWIESILFQRSYAGETLESALNDLFLGTELSFFEMYPGSVVILNDPTQATLRNSSIATAIREKKKIVQFTFGESNHVKKGQVIVSGKITDTKTKLPLAGVNVQVSDSEKGAATDENGRFSLSLKPGVHALTVTLVNYETKVIDLIAYADGIVNVDIDETPILLQEIVIQDQTSLELTTSRIGETRLSMQDLKRAPAMLGQVDLIKQIQVLPGVTTVGEAASGFNVRGGSVDQNLILYDGMPIFNSSHVFGFFSAFNADAIRDVTFYRGGIPAEYGGRVSSILDIQSKDGDLKNWHGSGGLGIITSNLMINGPLQKDKTSMTASFRSTYSNYLVHSIRTDYVDLRHSSVMFNDGTFKLTHLFSNQTKLSVTGYTSKDAFRLKGDSTYQWRNLQTSAKLEHRFASGINAEFVLGRSQYGYAVINSDYLTASKLSYKITSTVLKAGFNYDYGIHKINFGAHVTHYRFDPGRFQPESPVSNARNLALDKQYSIENALYIGDEFPLNDKLSLEAGVRIPMFTSFGPASINTYKKNAPREVTTVADTINFHSGEIIKTYVRAEPRLSFRWMAGPNASVKLGYNRMYQFLHLVTNTTAVTPVDIWQPSGYYFKPQRADQISLGYFRDFKDKKFGASSEVFYKSLKNILDFKDGAQLILNKHLETDLLQGKGMSYGIETSLSKNTGRLTGTLNYTYSRTFRIIAGPTSTESINLGRKYPASFDQPNVVNFSWKYNLSRRYFFTGSFVYHTGRPVTIPLSAFALENTTVAYFSGRNQYRIPDYHRLDVALVIEGNHKRKKNWDNTWVFSLYNVYGRKNPYTVFFKSSGAGIPKPYQLSIIGTILPSITYNFKF